MEFRDFIALVKPRVLPGVVGSSVFGYLVATNSDVNISVLCLLIVGCSLSFGGAAAFNQALEYHHDRSMPRTESRPIACGKISPYQGMLFGATLTTTGAMLLLAGPGGLTAGLAVLAFALYVFLYTPMKQETGFAMLLGTVPGALPALGGATASTGHINGLCLVIFGLLLVWQLPHFCALSWTLRKQYKMANFVTFSDSSRYRSQYVRSLALFGAIASLLMALSLPLYTDSISWLFTLGSTVFGVLLVRAAIAFYLEPTTPNSYMLVRGSTWFILSLPLFALVERI